MQSREDYISAVSARESSNASSSPAFFAVGKAVSGRAYVATESST
jgi:hypothetical protein